MHSHVQIQQHKRIFSLQQCSLGTYYMLHTVQGTGAIAVIQTGKKMPAFLELTFWWR